MREKRLIDINALIEWIDIGHLRNPLETCYSERDVVDMLESRPIVDAVEVVRCKDCKHNYSLTHATEECPFVEAYDDFVCSYWATDGVNANGYCSKGEMWDGETIED